MNIFKKAWGALHMNFLGGDVICTVGSVKGRPAMGTTADLQKATGELRVHLVRGRQDVPLVTIELVQVQLPGDGAGLACIRLPMLEAARLGAMLRQATDEAVQLDEAGDLAAPRD